jgi:predicted SAM-dependent methyltransferase
VTTAAGTELRDLERRLRELQRAYYEAPARDEAVILEYFATLARARALARPDAAPVAPRLHLGCGDHRLEGWWNLDVSPSGAVDALVDCTRGLPFADGAAAFIHCEDLLEHVERPAGIALLRECFRVLRPGGVLRILTPDLSAIVEKVYRGGDGRSLAWCARELAASGPCQALNMHMRMNGEHRFLYDEPELAGALSEIGFSVARVRWNVSEHPELTYLDLRDFGLNLFLEATRP